MTAASPGRSAPARRTACSSIRTPTTRSEFDAETRRLLRATIDFFEGQGKKRILDDDLKAQWPADFVEFVKREKLFATFLTPSEFADGNPEQALGRRPQRRARRDPRLLRADLLVHRAGHHPRSRTGLAEREQGRQAAGRRRPRRRRGDGVRALRARTRRRRLQHRHGAHPGQRGGRRQRHPLPGVGGEVLHRQRQRREPGVGVRPARRRRGSGRVRLLRRRQPPRELPPDRQRRAHADLRQHVPAGELPGAGRGHPAHRRGSLRRRAQYGQRRQVQPVLVVDRDDRARLLRGDHPRAEPHSVRQPGHRLRPRAGQLRRRLRPDDRDEGVQQARGRLLPQRQPRGPALPAVQPDDQGEGHDGGRDRRCARCTT